MFCSSLCLNHVVMGLTLICVFLCRMKQIVVEVFLNGLNQNFVCEVIE
jgi:hypothetical protein